MTIKEFEKLLKEDPELKNKLKEKEKEFNFTDNKEENASIKSKVAAALGFDVPASEFLLRAIENKELSDDELMAVAGGQGKWIPAHWCYYDYMDTDCWTADYCDYFVRDYD